MTLEDQVELAAWVGEIRLSWHEIERLAAGLLDDELDLHIDQARGAIRASGRRLESLILGDGDGDTGLDLGAVPA